MDLIASTDLRVSKLCLGSNVFGWTADRDASFAVLDAYVQAGGNFIDTADVYSAWAPGNVGGESESIIGAWMRERSNRDQIVIATKIGGGRGREHPLSREAIHEGVDASLERLGIDTIDLYYAHRDDETTPLEESLSAFDELVVAGKVRYLAASNFSAARLGAALDIAEGDGLSRFVALQPHYNLVHREDFEGDLQRLCVERDISCIPYYALASGFLTGKYRGGNEQNTPRAASASKYLDDRGIRVLDTLAAVATEHDATVATVALAWLAAQPAVISPIASARNAAQLQDLVDLEGLVLTTDDVALLSAAAT